MRENDEAITFSQHLACTHCGISFEEPAPRSFSFNSPYGACPACLGLGTKFEVDPDLVVPDDTLSLAEGALAPWAGARSEYFTGLQQGVAALGGFSFDAPWKSLKAKDKKLVLYGTGNRTVHVTYKNRFNRTRSYEAHYEGIIPWLQRRHGESESDWSREQIELYMREVDCPECKGARLKPESLAVTVGGRNIYELCSLSIAAAVEAMADLELTEREHMIADRVFKEVRERMQFLLDVGLDYLSLARSAGTLSGGEAQRIRLASQIGSGLVGVLYVLDEPSIGLHQRDNQRLIGTLERLRNLGNTVIVVEHDEETIRSADYVVDIGPGAGEHGGTVVHAGPVTGRGGLLTNKASITGQYLSGKKSIPVPARRRPGTGEVVTVRGAREHNLRDIDVSFPLGCFIAVTGVSGSGKSTLVNDILLRSLAQHLHRAKALPGRHRKVEGIAHLDKVVDVDQAPIGRTPRSNPATYTGVFDHIRKLFAQTAEAKVRGYQPGRFSFNVRGGRCEACAGDGTIKIEMHFLPDVYVPCEICHGARYNRDTLEITFRGKTIADVLDMSCEEALSFFERQPPIARHMQTLVDVGLGYVRLGQPAPTLSGGEAQRVKLASELSRRPTGHTFYILDEPTTGLHFDDTRKLLDVLGRLVDQGNTVVVIEHNLDVVKTADWIIDLGPEGGNKGGTVVAEGTPEQVAKTAGSHTGEVLKPVLGPRQVGRRRSSGDLREVRLRPLELDAVEEEVDLLVVEGDEARDGEHVAQREAVGPGDVRMDPAVEARRPVVARGALVGAGRDRRRRDEVSEVDIGLVHVVPGREARLEQHDGRGGLGEHDALGLHAEAPGRPQRVDPRVGVPWMDENALVLFEPGVQGGPLEADGVVEALDLRRGENLCGVWSLDAFSRQAEVPHVAPGSLFAGALVDERVVRHIGQRDVVLRVVGVLPDVAGTGRVDHGAPGQHGAHPPRRGLDVVDGDQVLGIVAH